MVAIQGWVMERECLNIRLELILTVQLTKQTPQLVWLDCIVMVLSIKNWQQYKMTCLI